MTKNMEDLLWRGDSLDRRYQGSCRNLKSTADITLYTEMSTMSSSLRDESLKYRRAARQINIDAMLRKWAP